MAALDSWIMPFVREVAPATLATPATPGGKRRYSLPFTVATPLRQPATIGRNLSLVAARRNPPATKGTAENQALQAEVAKVANVAAPSCAAWDATDWREYFEERAGIAEHCGGMAREEAERQAYETCITRWLHMHPPAYPDPAICPHCLYPNGAESAFSIPVINGNGYIWLHRDCHAPWQTQQRKNAFMALAKSDLA